MARGNLILLAALALLAGGAPTLANAPSSGAVLHVDDDNQAGPWDGSAAHPFRLVQHGIDAAADGDTVLVHPGVYVENIAFGGRAITVVSAQGPEVTVLDGNKLGSTVRFEDDEGPDSVLEGFTVTNGEAVNGGGILCTLSSPTLIGNHILFNRATMSGAGIMSMEGSPTIIGNLVQGNQCDWGGGGLNLKRGSSTVYANRVLDNVAGRRGGGIRSSQGSALILSNEVLRNRCRYGGGLTVDTDIVCNNLVAGNHADEYGGGISFSLSQPTFINNTVVDNEAGLGGGGIHCGWSGIGAVWNTILWGNSAPEGADLWVGDSEEASSLTIAWSTVGGMGPDRVWVEPGCAVLWGTGVSVLDPRFAGMDDRRLSDASPCLDAGLDAALPPDLLDLDGDGDLDEPLPFDLTGARRVLDGDRDGLPRVDQGALEAAFPVSIRPASRAAAPVPGVAQG